MKFRDKFRIYIGSYVILIFISYISRNYFDDLVFLSFASIVFIVIHFWFMDKVYWDAKSRNLTEGWCLAIFFLNIIGAIIYYNYAKNKPIKRRIRTSPYFGKGYRRIILSIAIILSGVFFFRYGVEDNNNIGIILFGVIIITVGTFILFLPLIIRKENYEKLPPSLKKLIKIFYI